MPALTKGFEWTNWKLRAGTKNGGKIWIKGGSFIEGPPRMSTGSTRSRAEMLRTLCCRQVTSPLVQSRLRCAAKVLLIHISRALKPERPVVKQSRGGEEPIGFRGARRLSGRAWRIVAASAGTM